MILVAGQIISWSQKLEKRYAIPEVIFAMRVTLIIKGKDLRKKLNYIFFFSIFFKEEKNQNELEKMSRESEKVSTESAQHHTPISSQVQWPTVKIVRERKQNLPRLV